MKQLSLGNESIAFQSDALFKDLTLIFKDMRASGITESKEMTPYFNRMERCIYEATGINTLLAVWEGIDNAIIFVPNLTKGNVLNTANFNKWLQKNFNADTAKFLDFKRKGWVDPAAGKVGGAWSEIVNRIYIGSGLALNKRFDEEEAAGGLIHEVGHAFTFLQKLADTVIVNAVLQRSWQELTSKNVDATVRVILDKAADDLEIKNKAWLESVTDGTDKDVAFRILVSAVQIEPREMDNKRFFTQTAFEELADIYAARHGAAKAIVTYRAKVGAGKYPTSFGVTVSVVYGLLGMMFISLTPIIGCLFFFLFGALAAHSAKLIGSVSDITSFKMSATKMANQLVEQLKQPGLPKEDIKPILDNLADINELIKNDQTPEAAVPAIIRFVDMFRAGRMDARSSRDYTDKLESLVSNILFVHAARLRAQ